MAPSRRLNVYRLPVMVLLTLLGVAGCASTPQPARSPWVQHTKVSPDALRLQKIADALLVYFQRYKRLPATLHDLVALPNSPPMRLTNPITGKPYVYAPKALPNNPIPVWLLAYDATPTRGYRWVILAEPPQSGRPVSMWVAHLSETAFLHFHPAAKVTEK